ncbi:hypothetical protein FN846DRAFT_906353 [Sphaerosporella brunnea]|uniref:Uncharacterized protein n=1 Tax=Sphaerosporella brunnea TaxID=1250544 RepID=A0A5J5EYP5_9PEZI|nr:hypothetical protein FN846DRAFT_906353 [Sphaerosporella brunnea]
MASFPPRRPSWLVNPPITHTAATKRKKLERYERPESKRMANGADRPMLTAQDPPESQARTVKPVAPTRRASNAKAVPKGGTTRKRSSAPATKRRRGSAKAKAAADTTLMQQDSASPHGAETAAPHGAETAAPHGTETAAPHGTETAAPHGTETAAPHGTETAAPRPHRGPVKRKKPGTGALEHTESDPRKPTHLPVHESSQPMGEFSQILEKYRTTDMNDTSRIPRGGNFADEILHPRAVSYRGTESWRPRSAHNWLLDVDAVWPDSWPDMEAL